MRSAIGFVSTVLLLCAAVSASTFTTPALDGVIGEDWGPESAFTSFDLDGCLYTLHMTWDAEHLWVGLESDTCRRFLGDGESDISFFVAIDVDQTSGSGGFDDGYGNAMFYGCFRPEYIYYFAGGAGWYEWGRWDAGILTFLGWRSDNTYYAWSGGGVYDDELGILWSDIGNPAGITVMAWITDETCFGGCGERPCAGVLAAWPLENPPAHCGLFWWGYPFFAPHTPGTMPLAGFDPNSVFPTNGEASAMRQSYWGGIKAIYR